MYKKNKADDFQREGDAIYGTISDHRQKVKNKAQTQTSPVFSGFLKILEAAGENSACTKNRTVG